MGQSGLDFMEIGHHVTFAKTVGETDVVLFAGITGDFSDTHINDQYVREKSNMSGRIAHGALIIGYMSTASTLSIAHVIHKPDLTDFPVSAGWDRVRHLKPVALGDTITVHYTVEEILKDKGRSIAKVEVFNQRDELVGVAQHIMRWAGKLSGKTAQSGAT